jgi:hypothetical protein
MASAAVQRGYELLGKSIGLFRDRIDVDAIDDQIIERLHAGRERARRGAVIDDAVEDAPLAAVVSDESKKPN